MRGKAHIVAERMDRSITVRGVPTAGVRGTVIVAARTLLSLAVKGQGVVLRRLLGKSHTVSQRATIEAPLVAPELPIFIRVGRNHLLGREISFAQAVCNV